MLSYLVGLVTEVAVEELVELWSHLLKLFLRWTNLQTSYICIPSIEMKTYLP